MAVSRLRTEWDQTAELLAVVINALSRRGGVKGYELNPFRRPGRRIATKEAFELLRQALANGNRR